MKTTLLPLLISLLTTSISARMCAEPCPTPYRARPYDGMIVTPGPNLPSLESLNLTIPKLFASLPPIFRELEAHTHVSDQTPLAPIPKLFTSLTPTFRHLAAHTHVSDQNPLAKRKVDCYPTFLQPEAPTDLGDYCIGYLYHVGNTTKSQCAVEAHNYRRRQVFCTVTDKKGHVIQVAGHADQGTHVEDGIGTEQETSANCKDVAFAVYTVLTECRTQGVHPIGRGVVVSGEEYAANGRLRVSVVRDNPLDVLDLPQQM
jgi:hypothetical protein